MIRDFIERVEVARDTVKRQAADVQLKRVQRVWRKRACFVCNRRISCGHREPAVDLAELEARG